MKNCLFRFINGCGYYEQHDFSEGALAAQDTKRKSKTKVRVVMLVLQPNRAYSGKWTVQLSCDHWGHMIK